MHSTQNYKGLLKTAIKSDSTYCWSEEKEENYKNHHELKAYLSAFLSVSIHATMIFGFLLSRPFNNSSCIASPFSISIYIRHISSPSSFALAFGWLNTLFTTPDATSPVVLEEERVLLLEHLCELSVLHHYSQEKHTAPNPDWDPTSLHIKGTTC